MIKSRIADSTLFGFDFQVNAAIVLMLENIENLVRLKMESDNEDIDITLNDGSHVLAQAKSVVNSSYDFSNVLKNLKKALASLSEGSKKTNVSELIYITNSPNPLKMDSLQTVFAENAHRSYSSLPPKAKERIKEYVSKLNIDIDLEILKIQILPFETNDEYERIKYVNKAIDDFVGQLRITKPGFGKRLYDSWHKDIFVNGTKKTISLNKNDLIWPAIVIATDIELCPSAFSNEFDLSLYNEIVHQYSETINSCCERFEFFTKVLFDYKCFKADCNNIEKCRIFALNEWKKYLPDLLLNNVSDEVQQGFIQIVLYNIVYNRITIDQIKRGANL